MEMPAVRESATSLLGLPIQRHRLKWDLFSCMNMFNLLAIIFLIMYVNHVYQSINEIWLSYRRLRIGINATPRQILINLCLALFFLYFIFLVGIDQVSHRNGCIFVAFLLQYFTLASLMWMGVEAYNLYFVVVRVFDSAPERFVLKAAIVAWGKYQFVLF